jgi:hypothetical protein
MVNASPRPLCPFTPEKENPYPCTGGGRFYPRADLDTEIYLKFFE